MSVVVVLRCLYTYMYTYLTHTHTHEHAASPLVEHKSEAYLPVVFVRTKACIKSSTKGLVSLAIQME